MKKFTICVIAAGLAAANTWATDAEVEKLVGSSVESISVPVSVSAECTDSAPLMAGLSLAGDLQLATTRHGQNGAVHELAMQAELISSTTYQARSQAFAAALASVESSSSAEVDEELVRDIYANVWRWGTGAAYLQVGVDLDQVLSALAIAESSSGAEAASSAEAGAEAEGEVANSTSSDLLVKGANIQSMESGLSVKSDFAGEVYTYALAEAYSSAISSALAYALIEEAYRLQLDAEGKACFSIVGIKICGTLGPITADIWVIIDQLVAEMQDEIQAVAQEQAEATAAALVSSKVKLDMRAVFENLPGTDDRLELVAEPVATLVCE